MTDPSALKPSVVGLAGPLIRMLGDRYGAQVKCPLLSTLELLLTRAGPALKAFLPQLQTTFLKVIRNILWRGFFSEQPAIGANLENSSFDSRNYNFFPYKL